MRAASLADVRTPLSRGWLFLGAAMLLTMILLAATSNGRHPAAVPPTDARGAVVPDTALADDATAQQPDRNAEIDAALQELVRGKTCAARRAAIPKLVELAAPAAIPVLKAARYRMRGGLLAFNETNTNACLTADAESAIKTLGKVE